MVSEKKVLIITYYWPPAGGPGVQRWLKLSKYLARFGTEVFILTVDPEKATYPLRDKSLSESIEKGIKVFYSNTSEFFGAYKKAVGKKNVPFSGFADESEQIGLKEKIARFVRGNLFLPDPRRGWNKYAAKSAGKIIEEYNITNVITTGPPHSTHLIGLKLRKKFNINWIADFRDPWTDIYYYHLMYPTNIAFAYDRMLERKVLERCDRLISVTSHWKDLYTTKSPEVTADKMVVIPNGFDPSDYEGIDTPSEKRDFIITYAGTITKQYPLESLIAAIKGTDFPIKLRIIGKWDNNTLTKLSNSGIEVEFMDYMKKSELNTYLITTDIRLFIIPEIDSNKGHVSGKLFDYMGAGGNILGIGPKEGDADIILQDSGAGKLFDYKDVEGIVDFLSTVRKKPDLYSSGVQSDRAKKYSRPYQAREVSKILR